MIENKYDDEAFFNQYAKMARSQSGLEKAEWHEFKDMLPDLERKRVLDLGCSYGGTAAMPREWAQAHDALDSGEKECRRRQTVI